MEFKRMDVEKHTDIIIPFRRDSFYVSFGTDEGFGEDKDYISWVQKHAVKYPDGFVLVLENDKPIGQLELTTKAYKDNKIGYVHLYYLIPEKRGSGLGVKLHQYAVQFFKKQSVDEYHLRVSKTNSSARTFYQKLGMTEVGEEVNGKVIRMKGYVDNSF